MHTIPDDPYRVAPPYCAPGEIEPREPTETEMAGMRFDVEREIFNSLKSGSDFDYFDESGDWSKWSHDTLWDVLINELNLLEMSQTMAAVMVAGCNAHEVGFVQAVQDTVYRKAITPFVEEQALRRMDVIITWEGEL